MSSLGGRCPKKLRNFDGRRALAGVLVGLPVSIDVEAAGSRAFSGFGTPNPLRMLMELARLVAFVDMGMLGARRSSSLP